MKMFVPFKENCFQLFGFDIMFDETLRPWLIEINFAPSLACGSPLDLKLKSRVVSDLLTLSGVVPYDPVTDKRRGFFSQLGAVLAVSKAW